jgi:hypothetical protein
MDQQLLLDFMGQYTLEVQELIYKIRTLISSQLPGATEIVDNPSKIIAYGYSPKYKDLVCAIAPYQGYLNLIFAKGSLLSDPDKILTGTGKRARHVKIRVLEDVEKPALAALIREADVLTRQQ